MRREFDILTVELCPECEEPCCREPSRVGPVDLLLAEAVGWRSQAAQPLPDGLDEDGIPAHVGAPCRHLATGGCTMPADLRPYGCTAYVCRPMLRKLDRVRGARVRRLVRQMGEAHEAVLARVRRQQRGDQPLI